VKLEKRRQLRSDYEFGDLGPDDDFNYGDQDYDHDESSNNNKERFQAHLDDLLGPDPVDL
jgi:hypothetical protein